MFSAVSITRKENHPFKALEANILYVYLTFVRRKNTDSEIEAIFFNQIATKFPYSASGIIRFLKHVQKFRSFLPNNWDRYKTT